MNDTTGIAGFIGLLEQAIEWLRGLGIQTKGTRYSQYVKHLREIESDPELQARVGDPKFDQVMEALDSGGELLVVQRDLSQFDSPELRRRLADFVKGPYFQRDERPSASSNRARNFGFELVFASQLVRAKFTPVLPEEGDLRTAHPDFRFECKRLQSEKQVARSLRDARDQLSSTTDSDRAFNTIALSVGKLVHGGVRFLHGGDHTDIQRKIVGNLDRFVHEHEHTWRASSFSHVSGVWIQYSGTAAFSRMNALVRTTFNRVIVRPCAETPEREAVVRVLASQLEENLGYERFGSRAS